MELNPSLSKALTPERSVEIDLAGDEFRQNWRQLLASWATRPPIYATTAGIPRTVLCSRYRDLVEVLNDRTRFTTIVPDVPGYESFDLFKGAKDVVHVDDAEHDRVRRLLNPAFGPAAVAKFEESIQAISEQMLDEVEALGGAFDAYNDYAAHLIDRVLLDGILKLTPDHRRAFAKMNDGFAMVQHIAPGSPFPPEYLKMFEDAREAIAEIVADRRANPGGDFISLLVSARDSGDKLSDEELFGNLFAICAAALTTSAISMAAALLNLCRHPDQWQALQDNPGLIPAAIEECIRYQGPGSTMFPRFAKVDSEVGGTKIPRHMPIMLAQQAANFDPEQYPDPLRFDIFRQPKGILTFGGGPHHCIGNRLARRILVINLRNVLQRFPGLHLIEPEREPIYRGMLGELMPDKIMMRIR